MTKVFLGLIVVALIGLTGFAAYNSFNTMDAPDAATVNTTATVEHSAACDSEPSGCPFCTEKAKADCCDGEAQGTCCEGASALRPGATKAAPKSEAKKE
jgi:hypothetical protein